MQQNNLTQSELKLLLNYCPITGTFTWMKRSNSHVDAGSVAGTLRPDGYINIGVKGKRYQAHRLAFLYMLGEFPSYDVDHINKVKNDNAWINLRPATRSENMQNTSKKSNNTSALKV